MPTTCSRILMRRLIDHPQLLLLASPSSCSPACSPSTPSATARGNCRSPRCRARRGRRGRRRAAARRGDPLQDHLQLPQSRSGTPSRCARCRRISPRAFRRSMPRPSARSSAPTACSTPGKAPIRRQSRSRCWRIRTWCRSRRKPRRTGSIRRSTAWSPTVSSGAAAPGTTRATSIRCWKPPRRWPSRAFARSGRSISPSAMTRKSPALRGAKAIVALLASRGVKLDFVLDEGLLITEGIMKGLDKARGADRRRREGLCDAGADRARHARPFLDAAARNRDRDDERGADAAGEDHRLPMQIARHRGRDVRHAGAGDERLQPRGAVESLAVQAAVAARDSQRAAVTERQWCAPPRR